MVDKRKKLKEEFVRKSSGIYISDDELISLIEERVPRIIRDKPYLKDRFRELFSDVFVEKRDLDKVLEEMRMEREASEMKFREMMERMDRDREEDRKRWEERMEKMDKEREDDKKRWEERMEKMERDREEDRKRWEERMEKWEKEREEDRKRWEEMREDTNKRFEEMREDTNKRFEAIILEMKQMREDMDKRFEEIRKDFHNAISAIGGRWGEDAESVFREGIKKILSEHYKGNVKKVWIDDKEGIIKGYRAQYEIDALITDSVHIIIEIKSQANDFDVLKLHRLGEIYEKEYNVKPRLLLLGIYVRESGWKEAKNWADVEIITNPRDFKP